jgi:hypothetical protein
LQVSVEPNTSRVQLLGTRGNSPAAGTILTVGNANMLMATFTPQDTRDYKTATTNSTINVTKAGSQAMLVAQGVFNKKKLVSVVLTAEIEPSPPSARLPTGAVVFEVLTKKGKKSKARMLPSGQLIGGDAMMTVEPSSVLNKQVMIVYQGDMDFMKSTVT